jgi:mannosyltransferase OCH1-like enzyme
MVEEMTGIPKVIHHFWFGPAPKPALAQRCIASWRAALHDYEIIEWTEANYDVHKSAFAREAHANGKWAYLTDFARLDVLHEYGGIYLDADVEVYKDFVPLLSNKTFLGFMFDCNLSTAVIGSEPGQPVIGELLAGYAHLVGDLSLNNDVFTRFFIQRFPEFKLNNMFQQLDEVTIYPKEYFDFPVLWGPGGYSMHLYMGSWRHQNAVKERLVTQLKLSLGRPGFWAFRQLTDWRAVQQSEFHERYLMDRR